MSIHAVPLGDDPAEQINQTRGELLADLTAGIQAMQRAAATLEQLRSPGLSDIELLDGRDGRDLATFLDDSIRCGRAAYAVMHAIIERETP